MDENVDNDGITKTIKSNKSIKFLGISIWKILAYFIIYSFLGFIVETLYGVATKGVIESRKSFLYGPFCGIYGIGAVILIVCLHKFSKKYNTLFVFGFFIVIYLIIHFLYSFFIWHIQIFFYFCSC